MNAPVYGLTPSQADCARVIAALTSFEGNSPSYVEIAAELSLSNGRSRVHYMVQALIERGWLAPGPTGPFAAPMPKRSLRLTRSPPPFDYSAIEITEAGQAYLDKAA